MNSLFALADELVRARQRFVLCTVVATERSAPRDAGARMLVRGDGSIAGTIGGGPLEASVIGDALELMRDPRGASRLFEASLTTTGEVHLGMKCGGQVRVLLDAWRPPARAVVFGAGHVGLKVVEAAAVAGWDVLLIDDRPERLALAPAEVPRVRLDTEAVDASCRDIVADDFVVIVTRCHEVDENVLEAALRTRARYIGLIGSVRKTAVIFRNLRAKGLPDPSDDSRVFSPIGLDLGSKEPGEIAISVLAELLAVRDGRVPAHRRLPSRSAASRARSAPAALEAAEASLSPSDAADEADDDRDDPRS